MNDSEHETCSIPVHQRANRPTDGFVIAFVSISLASAPLGAPGHGGLCPNRAIVLGRQRTSSAQSFIKFYLSFLSVFLISYSLSAPYYFFHSGALAKLSRKIALLTLSLMSYPSVRLSTYRNFRTAKNVFMELDKNEYYQKFISKFQFCF